MRLIPIFAAGAALALGACASDASGGGTQEPGGDPPTQCRAEAYSQYVGRNRSELPRKPANETWRVTCSTCPMTMDYNPSRLNIVYESATGIIREVKCG